MVAVAPKDVDERGVRLITHIVLRVGIFVVLLVGRRRAPRLHTVPCGAVDEHRREIQGLEERVQGRLESVRSIRHHFRPPPPQGGPFVEDGLLLQEDGGAPWGHVR